MDTVGIGLIGTGFMGKCHAVSYGAVKAVFGDVPTPRLEVLCDVPAEKATAFAGQFGFARATDDWKDLVADPRVDVVAVTTPNRLHREMVLEAVAAGKHVYVEKPLALTLEDAEEMGRVVRAAGSKSLVGYNYLRNPAIRHARELVRSARIGRVVHFRAVFDEDYLADGDVPWSWRCRRSEAGLGALGDMACHAVSLADYLVGPLVEVCADTQIVHPRRALPGGGGEGEVDNEDIATALLRFESGARGLLSSSRVAWGRKNHLAVELHGDRGTIALDQERMNELELFEAGEPRETQGFRTILTGPAHPPYGEFLPAPGHGLGFNDQKIIEVAHLLRGVSGREPLYPSIEHALRFERAIHAIDRSARSGAWERVEGST